MLASFPAGLVIYWSWNNLLSILQQSLIMKSKDEKGDKPERGERRRRDDEEGAISNNDEAGDDAASAE